MPTPASNYRPDARRCVNIIGEFDEPMAADVLPEILRLRQESNDPITVYIHSRGGFITTMEAIDSALQTSDLDGNSPRIITVAVGDVSSAAANLLTFGHYSIVYPESNILFHGIRVGEVQVTVEGAQNMTGQLSRLNRKVSAKIAEAVLPRIMFRFLQLRPTLLKQKRSGQLKPEEAVKIFGDAVSAKVGNVAKRLLHRCCKRVGDASSLSKTIFSNVKFSKTSNPKQDDPKVLRDVLKHEIKNTKGDDWALDEIGMQRLMDDYLMLRGFHMAQNDRLYYQAIEIYGPEFLTAEELTHYKTTKASDEDKAMRFLFNKSSPYISHLWFYTVTLSHNLFIGENQISARDAYWLGLVDEISGRELRCERLLMEKKEQPPKTNAPAPAAPTTPATQKTEQTSGL
jgi:ATP-dependent protease ClpP protease subunit